MFVAVDIDEAAAQRSAGDISDRDIEENMATFVLVHGAWHGGWCWQRVIRRRQTEHTVYAPTLTGLGERSHLFSPAVDMDTHIADVVNVIRWENLTDVVLCGHSYGGLVVTAAAVAYPIG
jgi:pimeloyl-ACP methyl ester carboxylesterase